MKTQSATLFQLFKYSVYALLTLNIFLFGREEYLAALLQFPAGVPLGSVIEAYASTIDTAAWVILLLMFELETFVLEDRHFTPLVSAVLRGTRVLCYTIIVYAFYGYIANLIFVLDVAEFQNLTQLCRLAAEGNWSYAIGLDEYTALTSANCETISAAGEFWQFGQLPAVVDKPGLIDIQRLAWVDVINSGVWIMVVLVLEIDVWLQEHQRYAGIAFRVSGAIKVLLYSILFAAAVYWGIKGNFVDFWDAFLWLLAFFFIEKNVIDWRKETVADLQSGQHAQA